MTGETIGIGLAVLAGLASLWAGAREARLSRYGLRAEGAVVNQEHEPGDNSSKPVIELTDRQGRPVWFRPATTGTGLVLGNRVPVAYLPKRPKSAGVPTRKYRLYPIVGLFFGAVLWLGVAAGCVLTR